MSNKTPMPGPHPTDHSENQASELWHRSPDVVLAAVIDSIHDPVILYDEKGKPVRANASALRAFGFDPTRFDRQASKDKLSITHLDGSPIELADLPSSRALAGQRIHDARFQFTNLNGQKFIVQASATPILVNGQVVGVVTVWRDISAEEKLAAENERQREQLAQALEEANHQRTQITEILESIHDGFFALNREWRFTYANSIAFEVGNRPPGDYKGKTIWELWPQLRETPVAASYQRAMQDHVPVHFETQGINTGSWYEVHVYPSQDGISVFFVDKTETIQAEQALRASEERFRQLADAMPQLVWTAQPDGTVDYYNRRYLEYAGIAAVQESEWQWAPVLHPDDEQLTIDIWQNALKTGETYQVEHRVHMKDGSYRWHLSRGIPVRDEQGRLVKWFGTATDIQDTKMAEQAAQKYAAELARSNQELEQFAFVASHDLQEPLRKIEAFGNELAGIDSNLNDTHRDRIRRMQAAAGRMRQMVEGLLALSRVTTHGRPFQPVHLSEIADDVLSDLEVLISRTGGRVEFCDLPMVEADPMQMRQLLQNLIGNALKYQRQGVPPVVKVLCRRVPPNALQIEVQDNGIGFDERFAERVFQPFERLVSRHEYEGSGIGLAICRKIVQRHGGTISAHSQPGQGSIFRVTLPLRQAGDKVNSAGALE